ncbi:MAG TPA: hypothetical protein VH308_08570 [Terracidiphilus sp.]|jgi:hypothetical protein|nr:hypothetical protein [Terracidiphilus sp.]
MSANNADRVRELLKQALPAVGTEAEPERDLWPTVLKRLDTEHAGELQPGAVRSRWVWFDAALLAGLAVIAVAFPTSIPLLLYYL